LVLVFALSHFVLAALSQLSALSQFELELALSQVYLAALSQFAALSQLTLS
jgi:hypothetical protein